METSPATLMTDHSDIEFKIKELSVVTDEALEEIINKFINLGWAFESIQFAMHDSSKRPAMAFVIFTRNRSDRG